MALNLDLLPTTRGDRDGGHTDGHNATNIAVNTIATAFDAQSHGHIVYSADPPAELTAIEAGTATSQTATIQAHLDWVKATWGGGIVDVSTGGTDVTCGGTTGLSVPVGVQLRADGKTKLYFPDLTTGSAITVNDSDFTPLIGVWIEGPNNVGGVQAAYPSGDASVGLNITGVGLRFYDVRVRYFGAGHHLSHASTYILKFIGGSVGRCGTAIYADQETGSLTEFGESIVYVGYTVHNSLLGVHATGNGLDLYFVGCSIDYCSQAGKISNAWVEFAQTHLESSGIVGYPYLFDVRNNSHVGFNGGQIIAGDRTHLFDPNYGPSNYGYGRAEFTGKIGVWFTDNTSTTTTRWAQERVFLAGGTTTVSLYMPFPLRWCTMAAQFVALDGYPVPNADTVRVSAVNTATGLITLTVSASNGADRWIELRFG